MREHRRRPQIGVLYAPGTNCHEETAFAVELAGGDGIVLPLHDLLAGETQLRDYQAIVIPGGFSYGDHVAAGRVFAVQILARLRDSLSRFANRHPVLGICNGYQVLMEIGLLPRCSDEAALGERMGALAQNRSARFESRWTRLLGTPDGGIWTEGLVGRAIRLPVAHGEGRMLIRPGCCALSAFVYVDAEDHPTEKYPWNPAGSPGGVAGTVDASGLVAGLMPHPERAALPQHGSTDGLQVFQNMVRCCGG